MKEHLSALIDGELEPAEFDHVLAQLHADPAMRNDWQDWHLVGDVMQQHPILSPDFMKSFSERLAAEPVVLVAAVASRRRRFMRRALAPLSAAASVAFLSVVGWQAFHGAYTGAPLGNPQMAAAKQQVVRVAATGTDNRFRAYLAAHHEDSGNPIDGRDIVYASFETQPTK